MTQQQFDPIDRDAADGVASRYKVTTIAIMLIIPVMAVAKLLYQYMLPDNFRYDSRRLFGMINVADYQKAWAGTYRTTAELFKSLDIFHFTNMADWSWTLGMVFTLIVLFMVAGSGELDTCQALFLLACVGLLNIYTFNIGKDIIQFVFFVGIYAVIVSPIKSSMLKIALVAALMVGESNYFREYYILIAAFVVIVYAVLGYFRGRARTLNARSVVQICVCIFVLITIMLAIAQVLMPDSYDYLMTARSDVNKARTQDGSVVNSMISDWIPGEGLPIFMLNFVIDMFRMLLPFELLSKGLWYFPFFCFQLGVTAYLVNLVRQINQVDTRQFLTLCVFIGYCLASFTFEPDYGSWVRHEISTFPILLLMVANERQYVGARAAEVTQRGRHVGESRMFSW